MTEVGCEEEVEQFFPSRSPVRDEKPKMLAGKELDDSGRKEMPGL